MPPPPNHTIPTFKLSRSDPHPLAEPDAHHPETRRYQESVPECSLVDQYVSAASGEGESDCDDGGGVGSGEERDGGV